MFVDRLKEAAVAGLLLGVKYALVLALLGAAVWAGMWAFTDYQKVRGAATMGEASYRWIIAGIQSKHLPEDWTKVGAAQLGVVDTAPVAPEPVPSPKKKK